LALPDAQPAPRNPMNDGLSSPRLGPFSMRCGCRRWGGVATVATPSTRASRNDQVGEGQSATKRAQKISRQGRGRFHSTGDGCQRHPIQRLVA
jgi:hypothetical protein